MSRRLACRFLVLVAAALGLFRQAGAVEPPKGDPDRHLSLGNPSGATEKPADKNNYLMKKEWFALSYNSSRATPNWVAWQLVKEDIGDHRPELGAFRPDDDLPKGFYRARPSDFRYAVTGFERGHMCPNADRGKSLETAGATFVMTNMLPQSHELNSGAWEDLERYCRGLARARKGHELYIFAGPAGKGGTTAKGSFDTTDGTIVVPEKCWKVVLVLDAEGGDPVKRVTADTRVIAVIMPNDTTPGKASWGKYRVSLKDVEQLTGYTFFDKVPPAIRKALREKIDDVPVPGVK